MTLIRGSSALGQPLLLHFQHIPRAGADNVRVNEDVFKRMRKARALSGNINSEGQCCHKNWPITAGANAEDSLDGEEFKRRIQTNILKLHPNAADVPEKGVMTKVNGGPGRLNGKCFQCSTVMGSICVVVFQIPWQ